MHNHNLLKNLGQRIKKRRIELELTQNALAKMAGYTSGSSINKIELGLVDITQTKAILIAKALNCHPMYLLGWTSIDGTINKDNDNDIVEENNLCDNLNKNDTILSAIIAVCNTLNDEEKKKVLIFPQN